MKSQSNYIPDVVWVREETNGIRHITLRRNFTEIADEDNTMYEYDEVEIYLVDRENIEEYVGNNFDTLFVAGLSNEVSEPRVTTEEKLEELAGTVNEALLAIMELSIE